MKPFLTLATTIALGTAALLPLSAMAQHRDGGQQGHARQDEQRTAPPPRYERAPEARHGYNWNPGQWEPRGHRHEWRGGYWVPDRSAYRYGYRANSYRDEDRDGIPNRYDRDRDGDGVPNRYDRRPDNPYRD